MFGFSKPELKVPCSVSSSNIAQYFLKTASRELAFQQFGRPNAGGIPIMLASYFCERFHRAYTLDEYVPRSVFNFYIEQVEKSFNEAVNARNETLCLRKNIHVYSSIPPHRFGYIGETIKFYLTRTISEKVLVSSPYEDMHQNIDMHIGKWKVDVTTSRDSLARKSRELRAPFAGLIIIPYNDASVFRNIFEEILKGNHWTEDYASFPESITNFPNDFRRLFGSQARLALEEIAEINDRKEFTSIVGQSISENNRDIFNTLLHSS